MLNTYYLLLITYYLLLITYYLLLITYYLLLITYYLLLITYEHITLVRPIQPCTTIADRELQLILRAKVAADILKQKPCCYLKRYRAIAVLP